MKHWPAVMVIVVDAVAWLCIHMGISYACSRYSQAYFRRDGWLYRERLWERKGRLYEKLGIRRWKRFAPDAGGLFRDGFRKRRLHGQDTAYLQSFLAETKRAELAHWLCIPPALLFFLWNKADVGVVMVMYAFAFNLPFIFIQRYNRIRLQRLLGRTRQDL
ncbi:glycosyl-4,4'-diaponeurosporenoate acyltransferase [Ectobacillus ponti]|uniref:Glycosyl-4,4'-diaponeurosporenoate acyltransferase n=1 Tax=Ectobacillus ponti TaxID=2961894 RepID=A0AA41XFQ4_9BACI|nr:glycosyl-4,4'-diaponeurosporenoate acyltransferase [Ectobacillus ponti]MCP8971281.1 glycosyl-4,4'-diaponeurosporenoate acyltransferase [Ectobacillus ponti]